MSLESDPGVGQPGALLDDGGAANDGQARLYLGGPAKVREAIEEQGTATRDRFRGAIPAPIRAGAEGAGRPSSEEPQPPCATQQGSSGTT